MSRHKALTAPLLSTLNAMAAKKGYNRQIADDAIDRLDPKGVNIAEALMMHEHAGGVPVAPHIRARVLMKWKMDPKPHEVMLDISMDAWDVLPDLPPKDDSWGMEDERL